MLAQVAPTADYLHCNLMTFKGINIVNRDTYIFREIQSKHLHRALIGRLILQPPRISLLIDVSFFDMLHQVLATQEVGFKAVRKPAWDNKELIVYHLAPRNRSPRRN